MTPERMSAATEALCRVAPVIPVLTIADAAIAPALAAALVAGGLPVIEVTLRTPAALAAIRAMAGVPGATVGAGTLLEPDDVRAAAAAGARFGVSPGATERLIAAAAEAELPLLPGAATASEMMRLLDAGFTVAKFFPAEAAGGVAALRALAAPLPRLRFCPTGGITPANAADYLALETVLCVGGSWVAPPRLLAAGEWGQVSALAREARLLGTGQRLA